MDRLDVLILRELMQARTIWPGKPGLPSSYRSIARSVGTSPGTVRNRIREMSRIGFFQGSAVYPNLNLIGLRAGSYAIEVAASLRKSEVIRELARIDQVVTAQDFRGNLLGLGLVYATEEERTSLLAYIDRLARSRPGIFSRVNHPPFTGSLTVAEGRLVSRLVAGGFRSYAQLARELEVSDRTLKRRIAKIVGTGAVLSFPRLEYRAVVGGVLAELLVSFLDPRSKSAAVSQILTRVEPWLIYAGVWEEFDAYRLVLPNVSIAPELAEEVGRIEGVGAARVEFVDRVIVRLHALRKYVDRSVEAQRAGDPRTNAA